MFEFATYYMAGVMTLLAALAVRTPDTDVRSAFVLSMGWPLAVPVILIVFMLDQIKWEIDASIDGQGRWFAMRRPVDGWRGLAVTFLRLEVKVWKRRK